MSSTMWAEVDRYGFLSIHLKAEGVWSAQELTRAIELVERFPRRLHRDIAVCVQLDDDNNSKMRVTFHWSQPEKPYEEPFDSIWLDQDISWLALERQVKENARRKATAGMRKILIVDVPPGEAPENIRKQWVGCEMPLMEMSFDDSKFVRGVLTGNRTENEGGYRVGIKEAISALRGKEKALEAVDWWEKWADSPFGKWADSLIFAKHVCQLIP